MLIEDNNWDRSDFGAGGGGGGGGGGGPDAFNLGATGVFGVDKGDGDSGIDKVSHDNIESDLIELDNEPWPFVPFVFIFKELLNA